MVTTNDSSYALALRPRITFKSIDGSTTYFTYDSFETDNDLVVTYCDIEAAVGESGVFNIVVSDPNNVVTEDNLRYVKVFIELGKTQATYKYFMIGFGEIFNTSRPATAYQEYQITGFGSGKQASELFIHRRETYKKGEVDSKIYKIVENAGTKRTWRPLKKEDQSIEDITGWDFSGISTKVNTPYLVVNWPFVYFSDVLDQLCSISGAVWFINFEGGVETFTLTYNTDLHTGVTIKSGDLRSGTTDDATKTGYIKKAFTVEDNSTGDAGIATRLITTQIIDKLPVFSQTVKIGATTLDFRAIAQQVIIDNDSRRLDSLGFTLSKVGDPDSPKDRVNGDIVLDNGSNKPTGTVLETFSIPLSQIKSNPTEIEVSDIDVSQKKLSAGQTKIWARLFQRSGLTGDPTHDSKNTIKWHHNNIFNTTQSLYSGTAPEGDRDKKDSLTWNVTNQGPLYALTINSNIRRLFTRTNKTAAQTLRLREVFVPTDFLQDVNSVGRFLSLNLSQTSKPRRSIQDFRVTVPNNFIYKPYQLVSFNDGLSDISQDLQVKRARYIIGSSLDDAQIGTLHCDLSLGGLYNILTGSCSCE